MHHSPFWQPEFKWPIQSLFSITVQVFPFLTVHPHIAQVHWATLPGEKHVLHKLGRDCPETFRECKVIWHLWSSTTYIREQYKSDSSCIFCFDCYFCLYVCCGEGLDTIYLSPEDQAKKYLVDKMYWRNISYIQNSFRMSRQTDRVQHQ